MIIAYRQLGTASLGSFRAPFTRCAPKRPAPGRASTGSNPTPQTLRSHKLSTNFHVFLIIFDDKVPFWINCFFQNTRNHSFLFFDSFRNKSQEGRTDLFISQHAKYWLARCDLGLPPYKRHLASASVFLAREQKSKR